MAKDLNLPYGVVSSGSSLKKSPHELAQLLVDGAVAKEMEAAAVAWVCLHLKKPLIAIKSITNLLDEDGESELIFLKNLSYACNQLKTAMVNVLNYCNGKCLADLSDSCQDD